MIRLIGQIFLGILLLFAGIYVGYLYLKSLDSGNNVLLLIVTLVCMTVGIFSLYKAAKNEEKIISPVVDIPKPSSSELEERLEKNNTITSEWSKTQEQRDRLKLLELAENAKKASTYND